MSKSKADIKLFALANEATTEILNTLGITPKMAVRRYITHVIELACHTSSLNGFKEAHADMRKSFKNIEGAVRGRK
jgi:hypothetical protein